MGFDTIQNSALWGRVVMAGPPAKERATYRSLLELFAQRVLPELEQIDRTFPEYTPHNEAHISKLFEVSELILQKPLISQLTPTEAFVLSASLIGHDWGMAVSHDERDAIVSGSSGITEFRSPDGKPVLRALIPTEAEILNEYCIANDVPVDELGGAGKDLEWQEYARRTHPERSAARIRHFFEEHNEPTLGEYVAQVSESHGHNLERLTDDSLFPVVTRERADELNVQAIAIYLRLIDLFDITQSRTPYELWRFVNPRNWRSATEWRKHRVITAIAPVGEALRIHGRVSSPDLWAEVLDLKDFCKSQFDQSRDLLLDRSKESYHLPIKWLDWKVLPDGFEPEQVRFEFDRERMFKLLGESIYGPDPYVFLRELLQNAIDATQARQRVLRSTVTPLSHSAVIEIVNQTDGSGEQTIVVTDPGIGMNRFAIRNYLSIAGKSIYRNTEFRRHKFDFDPISRFGIGILSCFAVANRVEIVTRPEPRFYRGEQMVWRIEISGEESFWSVAKESNDKGDVGTTVCVHLDPAKLSTYRKGDDRKPKSERNFFDDGSLRIAPYVRSIAGFVAFPIIVDESAERFAIVHPFASAEQKDASRLGVAHVEMLDLSYPFEDVFLPQDRCSAREVFSESRANVSDLVTDGVEGALAVLVPRSGVTICSDGGDSDCLAENDKGERYPIRQRRRMVSGWAHLEVRGPSNSALRDSRVAVFRNGILVPSTKAPKCLSDGEHGVVRSSGNLGHPFLYVNFTGSGSSGPVTNVARSEFSDSNFDWAEDVMRAHTHKRGCPTDR